MRCSHFLSSLAVQLVSALVCESAMTLQHEACDMVDWLGRVFEPPCLDSGAAGRGGGGVRTGGVFSRFGLVRPFLSFLEFFPIFFGIFALFFFGFFPICPFPLSRPSKAPTRNIPERVRDTISSFLQKSGKPCGLQTPRLNFS